MLLRRYLLLLTIAWAGVFRQARTRERAIEHALALVAMLGRRTISRTLMVRDKAQEDWSAEYRLFSRCRWDSNRLFDPVLTAYRERYPDPDDPLSFALDDTDLARTGTHIPGAGWYRDPLSPAFHVNFSWGLRFIQASLVFPLYREGSYNARGLPVRFVASAPVPKPKKTAPAAQWAEYRKARKQRNLSTDGLAVMTEIRQWADKHGLRERRTIFAVDASYANKTVLRTPLDRVEVLARTRKNAKLCLPAPAGSRRVYDVEKFTPKQVLNDERIAYQETQVWIGDRSYSCHYKEISSVLWQGGAGRRPLRLIVIKAHPYKLSPHSRLNYRQPAYLLTTDLLTPVERLIQIYIDRWQIEVNHREEKDIFGIGDAQVRVESSVQRHPAFAVACYSLLLLAGLLEFGAERTADYLPLPKWRRRAKRPSGLDLLALLRADLEQTDSTDFASNRIAANLATAAYG